MLKKDKLKIGIVGCGAIGSSLARALVGDLAKKAALVSLYDIDISKARGLSRAVSKNDRLAAGRIERLIEKSQLVIECASSRSSFAIAKKVLTKGRDIMMMSIGGIVGKWPELSALAQKHNARVYLPSGAISGIDALKAAAQGKISKVILTTRKNPAAFRGVDYVEKKGIKPDHIKEDTLLFSGSAKDAVRFFPQNINVAAVLSIAGIGEDKTQVRIIASPETRQNIHEINIESEAGKIFTRTENILHPDNPKTSYLAVLSAVATLKGILEPVKIGT